MQLIFNKTGRQLSPRPVSHMEDVAGCNAGAVCKPQLIMRNSVASVNTKNLDRKADARMLNIINAT